MSPCSREPDMLNSKYHKKIVARLRLALEGACDALQDEQNAHCGKSDRSPIIQSHGRKLRFGLKVLSETSR